MLNIECHLGGISTSRITSWIVEFFKTSHAQHM